MTTLDSGGPNRAGVTNHRPLEQRKPLRRRSDFSKGTHPMLPGPFEPPAAMIIIQGLTKKFGSITAVSGIDLTVAKGEVLGFLGPNGAGKSTTMKMIAGYFTPTAGR